MNKEILEEFDKTFRFLFKADNSIVYASRRQIKAYLSSALEKQRNEIVKVLEGMATELQEQEKSAGFTDTLNILWKQREILLQAISKIKEL